MGYFITWVVLAILIGAWGSDRKIGFTGAFLMSLLFSPLIGLIVTAVSKSKKDEALEEAMLKAMQSQPKSGSISQEISKLKEMLEAGDIDEDEFKALKSKLIGG